MNDIKFLPKEEKKNKEKKIQTKITRKWGAKCGNKDAKDDKGFELKQLGRPSLSESIYKKEEITEEMDEQYCKQMNIVEKGKVGLKYVIFWYLYNFFQSFIWHTITPIITPIITLMKPSTSENKWSEIR